MIFFFVKVFNDEKYLNDFLDGKIFANKLSYFRSLEDESEANRSDRLEGIDAIYQPQNVTVQIGNIAIPQGDFAGPITIQYNKHGELNVFCIYAGHSGEFESTTKENIADFRKQLELPDDCAQLGEHVVIVTNVKEFISRIKSASIAKNYGLKAGLVKYVDFDTHHGRFDEEKAVFHKCKEYNHQREYRFAFDTGINDDKPMILDIGSIRDITSTSTVEEFNNKLDIRLNS